MRTGWRVGLTMKRGDIYVITLDKASLNARPVDGVISRPGIYWPLMSQLIMQLLINHV